MITRKMKHTNLHLSGGMCLFKVILGVLICLILVVSTSRIVDIIKVKLTSFSPLDPVVEKKTNFVVDEIRQIAELTTAVYYEEILLDSTKIETYTVLFNPGKIYEYHPRIVIVVEGTIRAGYDLSYLSNNDIHIDENGCLFVNLPKPKILEVIANPSDVRFVFLSEEKKWSDDEKNELINSGLERIRQNAIEDGVLEKAEEQGKRELYNLFKALGFDNIVITAKE